LSGTTDISSVRRTNFLAVSGYIRRNGSAAIPRIAQDVGLSLPTVTRAVTYGLERLIFIPDGMTTVGRGRKAVSYTLNPDFKHCALFYFFSDTLHCDIYDFKFNLVTSFSSDIADSHALEVIDSCVRRAMSTDSGISHILFAVPGHVSGSVITRSWKFPSLENLDLAAHISDFTHITVSVVNNMTAVAGSSWKYTDSYHSQTLVVYTYGAKKYGAGVSVNGKVLTGASGRSCNIGALVSNEPDRKSLPFYTEQVAALAAVLDPDKFILYPNDPGCTFDMLCDSVCGSLGGEYASRLILGRDLYDDCAHGLLRVFNHELKTNYV